MAGIVRHLINWGEKTFFAADKRNKKQKFHGNNYHTKKYFQNNLEMMRFFLRTDEDREDFDIIDGGVDPVK